MRVPFALAASLVLVPLLACNEKPRELPQWTAPVLDQAEVIAAADEELMNNFVRVLEQRTGAQIAVFTVSTLAGQEPSMLATETAERWGVGNKEKDNGILVLVAVVRGLVLGGVGVLGLVPRVLRIGLNILQRHTR